MYTTFISVVLTSIVLAGYTCYSFLMQPTKSDEIINVIQDIYESQKIVLIDVIDLAKLLIKDTSDKLPNEDNNLLTESDLLSDLKYKSVLDETSILEDNEENPLGIVNEPSLPKVSEKTLPEVISEPLDNEQA
tara:strand:- start:709 stop:1107 length:399 start_codon:yes stop_codon:yes gene_type:complete